MNRKIQNFSWALGGNVGYLALQWLLISMLAKIGGPAPVGIYSLVLTFTAPVAALLGMRMVYLQSIDVDSRYPLSAYMFTRLAACGIGLVILAIAIFTGLVPENLVWITIAVGGSKLIDLVSGTYLGLFQSKDRMDMVAICRLWNAASTLVLVGVVYQTTHNFDVAIQLSLVGSLSTVLVGAILARRVLNQKTSSYFHGFTRNDINRLIVLGFPLGVVSTVVSLEAFIPRWAINSSLGEVPLGVYSALAYAALVVSTFFEAMGNSMAPTFARIMKRGGAVSLDKTILRVIWLSLLATLVGCFAAWTVGDFFVSIFYSDEFTGYRALLTLIILGAGIQSVGTILGWQLTILERTRSQATLQIFATIISVPVFYWAATTEDLTSFGWAHVIRSCCNVAFLLVVRFMAIREMRSEKPITS